jgi:hypothetical protein
MCHLHLRAILLVVPVLPVQQHHNGQQVEVFNEVVVGNPEAPVIETRFK